ncbi:MAG: ComEA family DNA-binding protein [Peptococcaceae bacterium]|nr:ComEA family DNA-binding protein [Peptococcaceae bacterium]
MLADMDRKQKSVIIIIAVLFVFSAGYKVSGWSDKNSGSEAGKLVVSRDSDNIQITVHISGAVEKPGVYSMALGSRVQDGIKRAVSLAEADLQGLNLAAALKDGQKLVVPSKQDKTEPDYINQSIVETSGGTRISSVGANEQVSSETAGSKDNGPVNINHGTSQELEDLPGLGPALVERIINYRETQGFFTSEEDIKSVPGIGDKIYEKIKHNITVN